MPHNFFPVLLAISLVAFPGTLNGQDDEPFVKCGAEYECGGKKMSYPFWGGHRPDYCGHPGFELDDCDGDAPELTMEGVSYRVLDINNSTNTLTVARADYWDNNCPDVYVNTTLNTTLFSYNTTTYTDVSIHHNCQNVHAVPNQFNCTHRNNYTITFCYFTVLDLDLGGLSIGSCDAVVSVPVFESAAKAIVSSGGSISRLREALQAGFGLVWNASNSLCRQCGTSGGNCGYHSRQSRFVCYCWDGSLASATCDNVKSPPPPPGSNLRRKIIIGCYIYALNTGIVAGVGGLILVLTMFGCHRITKCWVAKESEDDEKVKAFVRNCGSLAPKRYTYSDIKRMTNSFTSKLGQGGFGCVYEGKLSDGHMVAVKLLNKSEGNGQDFINEVASISTTSHVNIVTLLGFCFERRRRALVYEFMPNGSLDKFIFKNRGGSSNQNLNLEWTTLHQIAVGIARGLEYLHRGCNTRILHFDIKPHNILLDQNFVPKISDFGLAKLCQTRDKSVVSMTHKRGTPGYIAPEVFCRNFGGVSHKSDVYSYGMLVLEMVGGRKNFDVQLSQLSQIDFPTWIYKQFQLAVSDKNLSILESIKNEEEEEIARKMVVVSLWCIQPNPSDRPSIDKVVEMLEGTSHLLYIPPSPFMFSDDNSP